MNIFSFIGKIIGVIALGVAAFFNVANPPLVIQNTNYQKPIPLVRILTMSEAGYPNFRPKNVVGKFGATGIIPNVAAFFDTYLQANMAATDVSLTLASATTTAGTTLSSGTWSFVIDQGTASQEVIEGTVSGTAVTSIVRGIDPQNPYATSSAQAVAHGRGADIKVTDYTLLGHLTRILNNTDTQPNKLTYASGVASSSLSGQDIASVNYVNGTTIAGAPNASTSVNGIVQIASPTSTIAGTAQSSGGATLVVPNSLYNATSSATTTIPVSQPNVSGALYGLSSGFIDQTANYNWTGSTTLASTTITGSLNINSTTTISSVASTTFKGGVSFNSTTTFNGTVISAPLLITSSTYGATPQSVTGTPAMAANDVAIITVSDTGGVATNLDVGVNGTSLCAATTGSTAPKMVQLIVQNVNSTNSQVVGGKEYGGNAIDCGSSSKSFSLGSPWYVSSTGAGNLAITITIFKK